MLKSLVMAPIWFVSAFALMVGGAWSIYHMDRDIEPGVRAYADQAVLGASNTEDAVNGAVEVVLLAQDARVEIVHRFLERHSAALEPREYFAQVFVDTADRYGLDYRLLPAIAMQESNLCKKIPPGSFNCLGFGVHSRGTLGFENFEANFDRAARELKKNYIDQGLTTPEKIMRKYTPSSNGSWANSVNQWIAEMEYDSREKGRTHKTDADLQQYVSPTVPQN